MAIVLDPGAGGPAGPVIITNGTDGAGSDTSVTTGGYDGHTAKIIETHASVEKFGPIFVPYDPLLAALLAINF